MKKHTKNAVVLAFILISSFAYTRQNCEVRVHIDHYTNLPSGVISPQELEEFKFTEVYDSSGTRSLEYEPSSVSVYLKKPGKKYFRYVNIPRTSVKTSRNRDERFNDFTKMVRDSSHLFNIGDSIVIGIYYRNKKVRYGRKNGTSQETVFFYHRSYYSRQVYKITDASLVEIKRNKQAKFKIYPSPAEDYVNVKVDISKSDPGTVVLMNGKGQTLYQNESPDVTKATEIKLEALPSGTYYVQVHFKGEYFIKKFLKK